LLDRRALVLAFMSTCYYDPVQGEPSTPDLRRNRYLSALSHLHNSGTAGLGKASEGEKQ